MIHLFYTIFVVINICCGLFVTIKSEDSTPSEEVSQSHENVSPNAAIAASVSDAPNAQEEDIIPWERSCIKPQLACCKTLECVQDLLYQEEQAALEQLLDIYDIPDHTRKQFYAQWSDLKAYNPLFDNDYYPAPYKQFHDEKNLGTELVNRTKLLLKKNGINSDAVAIRIDPAYFKQSKHSIAATICMTKSSPASIKYNLNYINEINDHIILHEIIHLVEAHSLKRMLVGKIIKSRNALIYYPVHDIAYKKWIIEQEKQAELFPFIRFGCSFYKEQLVAFHKPEWLSIDSDLPSAVLNNNLNGETHPNYFELVPYITKINYLQRNGAIPLYKRNTGQI